MKTLSDSGTRSESIVGSIVARRYRVLTRASIGGMGAVYRAQDMRLGREVALKTLLQLPGARDTAEADFRRAALLQGSVTHPNIVPVLDVAAEGVSPPFLAMPFLGDWESLRRLLAREGSLPPGRAARITSQVLAALSVVHAAGIYHCDVKPENVMVGEGDEAMLTDFGVAWTDSSTAHGDRASVRGTPEYMAPELHTGAHPSPESDLFSVGVMLCEILTGSRPAGTSEGNESNRSTVGGRGGRPGLRVVDLPQPVDAVVTRALAADPARRHASAWHFATRLERATGVNCQIPSFAHPRSKDRLRRAVLHAKRLNWLILGIFLSVLVLFSVAWLLSGRIPVGLGVVLLVSAAAASLALPGCGMEGALGRALRGPRQARSRGMTIRRT